MKSFYDTFAATMKKLGFVADTSVAAPNRIVSVCAYTDGRILDHDQQISRCIDCEFVAPLSISFEEYCYIHRWFNYAIAAAKNEELCLFLQ
nr:hypothetical protein Caab_093 [Calliteara abietis nucleopolyhedrovirus]